MTRKVRRTKEEIEAGITLSQKKDMIDKRVINKEKNAFDICQIIKECTIDEISKYLIKEGNKRSFPDITTRQ